MKVRLITKVTHIVLALEALLLVCLNSCNKSTNTNDSHNSTITEAPITTDVAMTVSSIVDAINLDEPLDSSIYNFTGVLTDGSGAPLYTDIDGRPGEWEVRVTNASQVIIHNIHTGDLLTDDLKNYLTTSLQLNKSQVIASDENGDRIVYDFGKGCMAFDLDTTTPDIKNLTIEISSFSLSHQ